MRKLPPARGLGDFLPPPATGSDGRHGLQQPAGGAHRLSRRQPERMRELPPSALSTSGAAAGEISRRADLLSMPQRFGRQAERTGGDEQDLPPPGGDHAFSA